MAVTKSEHGLSKDNESLAVTGTFWQTTQPVSGFVTADITKVGGVAPELRKQTPSDNPVIQVQIGPSDPISNVPVVIDFPHHQIHEGESHEYWWTGTLNGTKDFRISVPAFSPTIRAPHMLIEVVSDATTTIISFFEDTTWTAVGTEDPRYFNKNRNFRTTLPATKIYVTGGTALTVNATGTQIHAGYLNTGNKAATNVERGVNEWILRQSTEYLLRVVTSASGYVLVRLHWYEDLGV
jgi:hypothetical protein